MGMNWKNGLALSAIAILGLLLFTQHGAQSAPELDFMSDPAQGEVQLELTVDAPSCNSLATVYVHLHDQSDLRNAPVEMDINGNKETLRTDQNGRFFTMSRANCGEELKVQAYYAGDDTHESARMQRSVRIAATDSVGRIAELQKSIVKVQLSDSRGSGVVLEHGQNTYILTNKHVVDPAQRYHEIDVITADGEKMHPSAILYAPNNMDLAIIVVEGQIGIPAKIASEYLQGEDVVALGSPRGIQGSVSKGIISNFGTDSTSGGYEYSTIQTDAAINPGNSGGGLFLLGTGELVGINSFRYKNAEGLNFAVDIRELDSLGDYHLWRGW
jgi:S1-C subfamily serine protease